MRWWTGSVMKATDLLSGEGLISPMENALVAMVSAPGGSVGSLLSSSFDLEALASLDASGGGTARALDIAGDTACLRRRSPRCCSRQRVTSFHSAFCVASCSWVRGEVTE